jgi:serine/threonine-protein kinase
MATEDRRSTGDALIGRTIAGKFTIESRVGGGGMGSVYRARQAGLDKIVAVKVLHRELLAEPTFATRFKREATSASRIDHPSSMRVIDFGEEPDGLLFIAMEYLEGKTLFKILREEAPLAPARIVALSRQILAALAAAHELGIVHRDLKPENVIVLPGKDDDGGASEKLKVCDFGIAKLQTDSESAEKLTLEGSIVGTPEYLSPEQARGGQLDARSDLYSMGIILFEMLTGAPPFRGDTPLAIVLKHLDAVPPRPSSVNPSADLSLEAVCLKALAKSPDDRYRSAREMRAALVTDKADAASPRGEAPPSRAANLIVMTETPPPVSSTQAPVPLTKRHGTLAMAQRPRLSEVSEPQSSGGRVLAAVIATALLAGGGGAYWFQKRAARAQPPVAAHDGPTIAPSATALPATTPDPTPAKPETAAAVDSSTLPPSELPPTAASAHHHHHGKKADGKPSASAEPEPAFTEPGAPTATAAPVEPPPAAAGPVKVHFSNVQVNGIASTNLMAALSPARFARCYQGAPGSHQSVSVHLELTKTTTKAKCALYDMSGAALGACIVDVTKNISVSGVPADGATADMDISFDAP